MSDIKFVYRLTNSQRMALCSLIHLYMMQSSAEGNETLPEVFVDCSEANGIVTQPADLLKLFMDVSERVKT